ncbi:MAG: GtrA family protein [Actinomycetota bacterium]|nr:GtrA family protein [Actinomycetota bacterium]
MSMTPTTVLDRVTGGRGIKAARFMAVSVVCVIITQSALALLYGVVGLSPVVSNVLAVSISTVPAFVLNKRWVWGKSGRAHVRREVLPFWGFTLLGLGISSGFVLVAHSLDVGTLLVMFANLLGFGVVWVAKFLFLDALIFSDREPVSTGEVAVSG